MPASQASNETRLPRAVLRRSAAITARYAALAESENLNPAPDAAPAVPPAPPAANDAPTADPPHVAPADGDPRENDPNYWKQRFKVTEGILARERDDRRNQFNTLNQRITDLQGQVLAPKSAAPAAEINLADFYTPEQIEAYGEEQCRVMAQTAMKAATATAKTQIDAVVQPIKEERERTVADQAAEKQRLFEDELIKLFPTWRTADKEPLWYAWLDEEDENGVKRQAILDIHVGNRNAAAIAKMFKACEKQNARPAPPITPNGGGAVPSTDTPPATPGAVAALTAPTNAEVKAWYTRLAIGKVKVTDEERIAFEARMKLRHPGR